MGRRQILNAAAAMALTGVLYVCTLMQPPETLPAAAERMTQTVEMQALTGTAIEMDVCETEAEARISAGRMTARGSAGYVHEDGGYRVLGIMLDTREEAEAMRDKLNAASVMVECYGVSGESLMLKVTAAQKQIEALTGAIHAVDMAALQPGRIAAQLDQAEINGSRARGLMAMLVSDLETAQADFRDTSAQGALAEALDALITDALAVLEPLTQDAGQPDLMLAGEMRCAGMKVWFAREQMIARLKGK